MKKYLLVLGLIASPHASYSQIEKITVRDTSINEESAEASTWVTVLDEKTIKEKNESTVADLLRDVPGIDVVRQGGIGQTTSIFIRGARSEDTLVLIDGIRANDLMAPSGGYDFSTLAPTNISRIEVHRGSQSVRFGSGALGGVINIITKEGSGPLTSSYAAEVGSHETIRGSVGFSGASGKFGYSLGLEALQTKGFSTADEKQGNTEADGAKVGTFSSKITYKPTETAKLTGTVRYSEANLDQDYGGGVQGDDPNSKATFKQVIAGVSGVDHYFENHMRSTLSYNFSEATRFDENKADPVHADESENYFISELNQVETTHEWMPSVSQSIKLILSYQDESGTGSSNYGGFVSAFPRQRLTNLGEGLFYSFDDNTWIFDGGLRSDQQSEEGHANSVRASVGRRFSATESMLRLTYATGFKNPSLFQLYSSYGFIGLKSQEGKTLDFSYEQKFGEAFEASVDLFRTNYEDLIDFDAVDSKYENIASAKSEGLELQGQYAFMNELSMRGSYTYLEAKDNTTGLKLLRRPMNAWAVEGVYKNETFETSLQYRFVGDRADVDPTSFTRIEANSYEVVNLKGAYELGKTLKMTARIENLLDREYQEVAGYGTPGRSFFVGISN